MKWLYSICALPLFVALVSSSPEGRIIGGSDATLAQFPFIASLRTLANEHFCSGFIHNAVGTNIRWVVTTAHCVRGRVAADFRIHLGTNSRTAEGVVHEVQQITVHPEYNANAVLNNIAILRTVNQIVNTGLVQGISLSPINTAGGVQVTVPGWGFTTWPGTLSDELQFATAQTMTREECLTQHSVGNRRFIYESTLCVNFPAGQGMCTGDGGVPIITGEGVTRLVVGLASWNMPCGTGVPDVTVRLSSYDTWITQNLVLI